MGENLGFLGEGGRLSQPPSGRLAETAFARELEVAQWMWDELSLADMAHVRELIESSVIPAPAGRGLLEALLATHGVTTEAVGLDPVVGDLYNNRDTYLQERFGDIVGMIHTGRARREATTVAWHLRLRHLLIEAIEAGLELAECVVDVAAAERDTLMPDFTYLQHAHPTTLGHYLLGFAYPIVRGVDRLGTAFASVNQSPAGSGSVNGSRFPLDRSRMAADLEFEGIVPHTRDAMWAPDVAIEVGAAALSALTTIDRFAEELQIWATSEFGFVEFADRHTRTSVIMPQKQNPYGLAMIRGHARTALGDFTGIVATNLTPSGQPDNRTASYDRLPATVSWGAKSHRLLAEMIREARFDRDRMAAGAAEGYAYATDLCDFLVQAAGIENRVAHQVVGLAVRSAIEQKRPDLDLSAIMEAATALDVHLPNLDEAEFSRNLDARYLIEIRRGQGGAGQLDPMFEELRDRIRMTKSRFADHPLKDHTLRYLSKIEAYKEQL